MNIAIPIYSVSIHHGQRLHFADGREWPLQVQRALTRGPTRSHKWMLAVLAVLASVPTRAGNNVTHCQDLMKVPLPGKRILSAEWVPADAFQSPNGESYRAPAFCRVQVAANPTADSDIRFEVWLPDAKDWTGRYYQHGEGGGGGQIDYASLTGFVRDGAVGAATNDGGAEMAALIDRQAHPQRLIDNQYRALQETAQGAREITLAYYGHAPRHRYFEGCSGGGMYALKAAKRFPEDWDGILVGAANTTSMGVAALAWNARTWLEDPLGRIVPEKLPAIQRAALASCTAQAHVVNGIATDPRRCPFDPKVLSCKGPETDVCLTTHQLATLQKIYVGPRNPRTGIQIYPGFPPTSEIGWVNSLSVPARVYVFNPEHPTPPYSLYGSNAFYRSIFDDPHWNVRKFDFDKSVTSSENTEFAGASLKSILDADDPDLSAFWERGSKMLMYVGWGDHALTPFEGVGYYEKVAQAAGGIDSLQHSFRLFMAPGMYHCAGGPGANAFGQGALAGPALQNDPRHNIVRALEAWAETDRSPDQIIATKYIDDDPRKGIEFTRPLCPYPQLAVYAGVGSTAEASNFECKTETGQR